MKNPKKSLILSVLLIGAVLALLCTACAGADEEKDKEYTVKYEVTGPATVANSLTYENATGGHDQKNNVNIPWSYTFNVSGKNIGLHLFTNFGVSNENTYTTNIYVNGKLEKSSSGIGYVSVSHFIY